MRFSGRYYEVFGENRPPAVDEYVNRKSKYEKSGLGRHGAVNAGLRAANYEVFGEGQARRSSRSARSMRWSEGKGAAIRSTVPAMRALRPSRVACSSFQAARRASASFCHQPILICTTFLPCLTGSDGDAERREGVDFRDGGLEDVLVELAEGFVFARLHAQHFAERLERIGVSGFLVQIDQLGDVLIEADGVFRGEGHQHGQGDLSPDGRVPENVDQPLVEAVGQDPGLAVRASMSLPPRNWTRRVDPSDRRTVRRVRISASTASSTIS